MSAAITSTLRMFNLAYRSWNFRLKLETNRCRTVSSAVFPMYKSFCVAGCRYAYRQLDQRHGARSGVWGSAQRQCRMTCAPSVDGGTRVGAGSVGLGASVGGLGWGAASGRSG